VATAYDIAKQYAGQHEGNGNALLNRFLNGDTEGMTSAQFAWCSRFVKQAAIKAGVDPKTLEGANDMARSWLNVGEKVDTPNEGDLVVLPRGDPKGPYGHVGFYAGQGDEPGTIKVFAGNQGDAVTYANVPANAPLGYRRLPGGQPGAFSADPQTNVAMNGSISGGQPATANPSVMGPPEAAPPQGAFAGIGDKVQKGFASSPLGTLASGLQRGDSTDIMAGAGGAFSGIGKALSGGAGGAFSAFGGGQPDNEASKNLAEAQNSANQANAQALSTDEQRQAQALQAMLQRRQQPRGAFA
jgi:uncharacterized protein (TIGR02594 family)